MECSRIWIHTLLCTRTVRDESEMSDVITLCMNMICYLYDANGFGPAQREGGWSNLPRVEKRNRMYEKSMEDTCMHSESVNWMSYRQQEYV